MRAGVNPRAGGFLAVAPHGPLGGAVTEGMDQRPVHHIDASRGARDIGLSTAVLLVINHD
jgi:hypothetical protein